MKRSRTLRAPPPPPEERIGPYCGHADAPPISEIRAALADRKYEAAYVVDRDILFYGGPDCVAASGGLRGRIDWDVHNHPNEMPMPSNGDACHAAANRLKRMDIVGYLPPEARDYKQFPDGRWVASYREPRDGWPCYDAPPYIPVGLHAARAYTFDGYMKLLERYRRYKATRPMREERRGERFALLEIDGTRRKRR